jgi:hypothetical protein
MKNSEIIPLIAKKRTVAVGPNRSTHAIRGRKIVEEVVPPFPMVSRRAVPSEIRPSRMRTPYPTRT